MSASAEAVKAHVARLYFLRKLTKQQIAERLGISRFKVARLLDQARAEGIVQFEIREPVAVLDELAAELERRFGLELAVVVRDEVARAGAALLPRLVRDDDVVGVAWGATLQQLVGELEPQPARGTPVVQICGAIAGLEPGAGPTEVALRLTEKLGGILYALPAPALTSREGHDALLANEAVRPTVEMFERVTLALVGIGVAEGGGHILVHVFGEDGTVREADLPAIALSADQLRRARAVALAGGAGKERAILGALRTGLLNVLVTDERNAVYALEAHR